MTDISVLAKEIDALHLKEKERYRIPFEGGDILVVSYYPPKAYKKYDLEWVYLLGAIDWRIYWKLIHINAVMPQEIKNQMLIRVWERFIARLHG